MSLVTLSPRLVYWFIITQVLCLIDWRVSDLWLSIIPLLGFYYSVVSYLFYFELIYLNRRFLLGFYNALVISVCQSFDWLSINFFRLVSFTLPSLLLPLYISTFLPFTTSIFPSFFYSHSLPWFMPLLQHQSYSAL